MKMIYKIAKTELMMLFFSPIAWFLMIVFFIQCGYLYSNILESNARVQELGGYNLMYLYNLTERFFLGNSGLFGSVMQNLYLYIPLLTMSLISREMNSGTIKLLYSSPIKVWYIVLGKYVAMMVYSMVMLAIISVFVFSGMIHIQHAEISMLFSAFLGFYLVLLAYSAIGLFMSTLTTYQVVAAISTFVMIGALSYVGNLWQDIPFVRDLTYFLSINGRAGKMLSGLITTNDVIYFFVVVYIFLGFSILKLKAGMESKPWTVKAMRYGVVLFTALLIGYFSSRPGYIGYLDVTSTKSRTLTPNAQKILAQLGPEPLEITVYNNLLSRFWFLGTPKAYNDNLSRWEPYMRFKPNIILNTVYYYDEPLDDPGMMRSYPGKTLDQVADQFIKSRNLDGDMFVKPVEIRKQVDLSQEMNRYVMQLKWKGRTTWLRVFDDQMMWPSETEVAAAFKRLLQAKLPKIGFLTGNLERSVNRSGDRDYKNLTSLKTFRQSFINQGFDVDTVTLDSQTIPKDISTLVVADPKIPMSEEALDRLKKYIDEGGNLLVACEPDRQTQVRPLLSQLGVVLVEGQIVQKSRDFAPNLVTPDLTRFTLNLSRSLEKNRADSMKIAMPGVAGLKYTPTAGFTMQPLLVTNPDLSWNKKGKLDLELITNSDATGYTRSKVKTIEEDDKGTGKKSEIGTLKFLPEEGDEQGSFVTALSLSRKINNREQRIIVTGDADFMSNAELGRLNMRSANFDFNTALFKWLSNGEFPVDTSRPMTKDRRVTVDLAEANFLRMLYVWILPALLALVSTIFLMRRKRK